MFRDLCVEFSDARVSPFKTEYCAYVTTHIGLCDCTINVREDEFVGMIEEVYLPFYCLFAIQLRFRYELNSIVTITKFEQLESFGRRTQSPR